MPENVHVAYSRSEDAYLWEHRHEPLEEVAETLGRGAKSCAARLDRLRNPSTAGHRRLFGGDDEAEEKAARLRPVRDCIQRVLHDPLLDPADFRFGYHDRFHPFPRAAPFDAPNDSVEGGARSLVLALPEHRIECLWYRGRLVWHKASRLDDVFGSRGGLRIQEVVDGHADWTSARKRRAREARNRALRALGGAEAGPEEALTRFNQLLVSVKDGATDVGSFVEAALSPSFFGADGRGAEAAPGEPEEAPLAVVELVGILPDEHWDVRAALTDALSERIGREVGKR